MTQLSNPLSLDSLHVIGKLITEAYRITLTMKYAPTLHDIRVRLLDHVQRNALDLIYPEINFNLSDEQIEGWLYAGQYCYTRTNGEVVNDAQNFLDLRLVRNNENEVRCT